MSERMSIHRALAELKTLDARIDSACSGTFIYANKKSNAKISGMSIEDAKKFLVGNYDRAKDLIERRKKIKSAIVESNAKTEVEVAGIKMTVADAIERKSSVEYEKNLLSNLKTQFQRANSKVTSENEVLPQKLETYLSGVLGAKDQRTVEEVDSHTKSFMTRNEWELIDPLHLNEKIRAIEDEIINFEMEVDATLSEVNAITFIEI
jgi:hypothetical protein